MYMFQRKRKKTLKKNDISVVRETYVLVFDKEVQRIKLNTVLQRAPPEEEINHQEVDLWVRIFEENI